MSTLQLLNYRLFEASSDAAGAPPLLMIHGLDSASQTFYEIAPQLARSRDVILIDQRGHGSSPELGADYSTHAMASDAIELLDHLGIKQFAVLGHSLGARTAVRIAELSGERCQALIIEDMEMRARSAPLSSEQRAEIQARAAQMRRLVPLRYKTRSELESALRRLYGGSRAAISSLISRRAASDPSDGSYRLLFRPWSGLLYSTQANAEDLSPIFAALKLPTLVLRADPKISSAVSDAGWEQMHKLRPDARFIEVSGASHSLHWDAPQETLRAIRELLPG